MTASAFTPYPLLLNPFYSPRPWGGSSLKSKLGKPIPADGQKYGEAWELSDHPDGRSTIANGPLAGKLFGDAVREYPRELLGLAAAPQRYPLLVKYIDSAEDLSVQVHPTNETAPPGDRGKTECWYIMHAEPGAVMIWGLQPGVDADLLRGASEAGGTSVERCIRRVPVSTGDFVYIPAGTVHATMAGILLCEVQQSSNTTYRLYDWDRQPPRPLHIENACAVTNYDPAVQKPEIKKVGMLPPGDWHELIRNDYFIVRTLLLNSGMSRMENPSNQTGLILCVPEGEGELVANGQTVSLKLGQTWFLPAPLHDWSVRATANSPLRLILSESRELA